MGPAQAIASRLSWCGIQYLIGQRAYGCCVWGWSLISAKLQDSKDLLGCCNLALSLSLFQEREYTRSTRYWSFDGLKPWVTSLSNSFHFSVVPPYRFSCYIPFTTPTLFAYIIAFDNKDDRYYKDGSTGRVNFVVDTCMYTDESTNLTP